MPTVEELTLYLTVSKTDCNSLVDGQALHDDVIARLPRLKHFHFSIVTKLVNINTEVVHQTNEQLRRSLVANNFQQVGSYIDRFISRAFSNGHVYSLPYTFSTFTKLTVPFPGGRFNSVRTLQIMTSSALKPDFYQTVAEAFPFVHTLYLVDLYSSNTQEESSDDTRQIPVMVTFPRLHTLQVGPSNIESVQQFLFHRRTHLPALRELQVGFEQLTRVTNNFTSDEARATCSRVRELILNESFVAPEHFHTYFPLLL